MHRCVYLCEYESERDNKKYTIAASSGLMAQLRARGNPAFSLLIQNTREHFRFCFVCLAIGSLLDNLGVATRLMDSLF